MSGEIMTEVGAIVPRDRADDVPVAFAELTRRALPDGLLRTELLAGRDGEWKIQSVCAIMPLWTLCEPAPNRRPRPRCSGSLAWSRCCGYTIFAAATSRRVDTLPTGPGSARRQVQRIVSRP